MQRYRINYHWLIGVFATCLVLAVVAFFVWRWQVDRKAGYFLVSAEEQLEADEPLEAYRWFYKYVQLKPDEDEARVKLAHTAVKVIKSREATFEEIGRAFGALDQAVRRTDDSELRRELAEIMMMFRRPQDAISHIEALLVDSPKDSDLNAMLVRALVQGKDYNRAKEVGFNAVGYDKKTDQFDPEQSVLKDESDVYALLASVLVQKDKDTELARRVIDEMIAANPDSPEAFLQKSVFLSGLDEAEEASEFLDKAYGLDPKNAAILARKGLVALNESNIEEAKQYYTTGIEEHKDNPHFYRMMAEVEQRLEQPEAALAILDKGIEEFDKDLSVELVLYKIELQLNANDFDGAERSIDRLVDLNRPDMAALVDFQRARILFRQRSWLEASKELKRVRPLLVQRPSYRITVRPPNFQAMAGFMLGVCYESLGSSDLALQAYNTVLGDLPAHTGAIKGRDRILARIRPNRDQGVELDEVVNKTLELPEAEQDWEKVDELVESVIAENELSEARQKLLRAKVLLKREMFDEAKALIREAAEDDKDDIDVHFAAILLVRTDPQQGPADALLLLDNLEKRWGRSLRSIIQRADLLVDAREEDVAEQLRLLASDAAELTEAEQKQMDKVLGLKFEQLGDFDSAREYYEKAIRAEPGNLPLRMHMFDLALRHRDDAAMQKAQESILEFVKSKDDPSYILTEVKRRVIGFTRDGIDQAELAKCRELLDQALVDRPEWHELHITYGQVLLLMNADMDLALKYFDDALKYGPAKSNAVSVQVKLLAERGLYQQAKERMQLLRPKLRTRLLGRTEAEILIKTGDTEAGFAAAESLAESQPNKADTQLWFSKIAQELGKLDVATTALRSSLKLNSSNPDNWIRLVGLYAEQKKLKEVESVIREAHLSSEAEFLPLLTAKYQELLSRWQGAERIYLASYDDQLGELAVSRRLADFYLLWSKKDEANLGRAAVYINRILRAANDGDVTADNPHVVWARQKAARILLAKKDYRQSLKAERLLRQSAINSRMTDEEAALLTDILLSRGDPTSLKQAVELLTKLRNERRLTTKGALQLARLFSQTEQWGACQDLMFELLADNSDVPEVGTTYIELLIDQGEYRAAETRIKRLRREDVKNPFLIQLSARLASERGDQAGLNKLLVSLLPNLGGALNEAQLKSVASIAQLATRYGDYELAEKLYRTYTSRVPAQEFELAKFLAYHGDCEEAIERMRRLYDDQTDSVIQLANRMIKARRDEIGDKYDEAVDRLINASLQEDPDSITRQLARAEAYDTQEKYQESINTYEQLLARTDVPTRIRAAAMNNLGFQLGLLKQRVDEAEQLINEAMETFGPVADMLDTRAVVRIAQEKYDLAIEDMELAVSMNRDPVKYFHLAKACILAGDGPAATKAWEKAQALGFEKAALSSLEKSSFDDILRQIESFQTQNAKL